jgi:uncharacterized RDD family membrane protein YckC
MQSGAVGSTGRREVELLMGDPSYPNLTKKMLAQLINLAVSLLIAWLVVRYYAKRLTSDTEKYSTFGPRFWTGAVDACVMWPLGFIVFLVNHASPPAAVIVTLMIIQQSAWLVYTIGMHAKYGQTLGKMACKVKVVDFKTERAISLRQAVLREGIPVIASLAVFGYEIYEVIVSGAPLQVDGHGNLEPSGAFWGVTMIPLAWFAAEVLTMLTNDKRRALHDLIAGTVVIRTDSASLAPSNPPLVEAAG